MTVFSPEQETLRYYRARAFALTFLTYACFHLTRKVPSVTKSVLHPQSSTGKSAYDPKTNPGWAPFNDDLVPEIVSEKGYILSGAGEASGTYKCNVLEENRICRVYSNGKFNLSKDDAIGCPLQWDHCWLILEENESGGDILYAQHSEGLLPAVTAASEAPDCIHWMKQKEPGVYVDDKDVKAKPNSIDGGVLLGTLDSIFLTFYTVGLFVSGYLGDRVDLRKFLVVGMGGSAICMVMMALAYSWKIHSMAYFVFVNIFFGLFQSIGWPSVVAVMGSWFGHGNRGFIMGVWNSHTSLGNILGSVITAASVGTGMNHEDWPLGYAVPGLIMFLSSIIVYSFLIADPAEVGLEMRNGLLVGEEVEDDNDSVVSYEYREAHEHTLQAIAEAETDAEVGQTRVSSNGNGQNGSLDSPLLTEEERIDSSAEYVKDANFFRTLSIALRIPGLIPFSISLFFSKMCAYSLLFWGPYYLGSLGFKSETAGYLCSFFDIGGVFGGIVAGMLSDRLKARGVVAFGFQVVGVPVMALYYNLTTSAGTEVAPNIWLMILVGFFINAPYALITTAVSADLGSQLEGNDKLLALVTGIIDGTGSFGAVVQGVVVGMISSSSWSSVWHFLMVAQALSALMLSGLVARECRDLFFR